MVSVASLKAISEKLAYTDFSQLMATPISSAPVRQSRMTVRAPRHEA